MTDGTKKPPHKRSTVCSCCHELDRLPARGNNSTRANWLSGVNTKRQKSEGTQESITSQDRRAAIETPGPVHRNGAGGHRQKAGASEAYRDILSHPNPGHGTARRGRERETRTSRDPRHTPPFHTCGLKRLCPGREGGGRGPVQPGSPLLCFKQRSVG